MVVTPVFGVPHVYDFTPNLFSTSHRSVLVCVHGWLLSRTYWQPLMQQLAPDIAVLPMICVGLVILLSSCPSVVRL